MINDLLILKTDIVNIENLRKITDSFHGLLSVSYKIKWLC